jgi:hypothetical protein
MLILMLDTVSCCMEDDCGDKTTSESPYSLLTPKFTLTSPARLIGASVSRAKVPG